MCRAVPRFVHPRASCTSHEPHGVRKGTLIDEPIPDQVTVRARKDQHTWRWLPAGRETINWGAQTADNHAEQEGTDNAEDVDHASGIHMAASGLGVICSRQEGRDAGDERRKCEKVAVRTADEVWRLGARQRGREPVPAAQRPDGGKCQGQSADGQECGGAIDVVWEL